MRSIFYFSHVVQGVAFFLTVSRKFVCCGILLCLTIPQAAAFQLDLEVNQSTGGTIGNVDTNYDCKNHCRIETFRHEVLNLIALPEEGYRFVGWEGRCETSMGQLCTLKLNENAKVGAIFAKRETDSRATQAILLLHDLNEKHTVWNEFVKQRFNNRCPVVYGGVLLEQDSFDAYRQTACYRIAFGYYNLVHDGLMQDSGYRNKRMPVSTTYLAYEIRSAVLALLNRHPALNLMLIGHGRTATAALSYLQTPTGERKNIGGLLTLVSKSRSNDTLEAVTDAIGESDIEGIRSLKIAAHPMQGRKINAALADLAQTEWP